MATGPNQVWANDFVFDDCTSGDKLKCLTNVDKFTKESLYNDAAKSNLKQESDPDLGKTH